jgi:hypothetical protein
MFSIKKISPKTFGPHCVSTFILQPLQNGVLHRLQSSASSFNYQHRLVSLSSSSSSCLCLLPRLPIISNLLPILPSNNVLHKAFSKADVTNPLGVPPFYCTRIRCQFHSHDRSLSDPLHSTVPLITESKQKI